MFPRNPFIYDGDKHRRVASVIINRPLRSGETVHHVNGIKGDNRPENLWLFATQKCHAHWHSANDHGNELCQMVAVDVSHRLHLERRSTLLV